MEGLEYYLNVDEKYLVAYDNFNCYPAHVARLIDEILEEEPCHAETHNLKGLLKVNYFGDLHGGETHFRYAIKFNAKYAAAHYNLVWLLWKMREYKKLQNAANKALEINTVDRSVIHEYLGRMYFEIKEFQLSKKEFKLALHFNKNDNRQHSINSLLNKAKAALKKEKKKAKKRKKKRGNK